MPFPKNTLKGAQDMLGQIIAQSEKEDLGTVCLLSDRFSGMSFALDAIARARYMRGDSDLLQTLEALTLMDEKMVFSDYSKQMKRISDRTNAADRKIVRLVCSGKPVLLPSRLMLRAGRLIEQSKAPQALLRKV